MSKPRPPKVNPNFSWASMSLSPDLFKLRQRFKFFEEERRRQETEKTYIALDAVTAFCGARILGYSDEDLRKTWPTEWGDQVVTMPYALLKELADAWVHYQDAPPGKTFGEVLGIEGGGQGKSRTRERRKARDAEIRRTNAVWFAYINSSIEGRPISLERAKQQVAEMLLESTETITAAFKKHGKVVKHELILAGILLEG